MKFQRLLSSLLAVCFFAVLAQAQTPYIWETLTIPSCQAGTTIVSTNDLDWQSPGCVDVTLSTSNDELTFIDDFVQSPAAFSVINGYASTNTNDANILPGTLSDVGILSWSFTGDLQAVSMTHSIFVVQLLQTNGVTQEIVVPFDGFLNPLDCGIQLVAGGSTVNITRVQLVRDTAWAASVPFNLTFNYTYTSLAGGGNNTLNGISVPDTDFNGTTYEHVLPSNNVNVVPVSGLFEVGLENNTPTEQVINIYKSGGGIIIAGNANLQIQQSTSTMEPHEVNVFLDSVGICLGNSEFLIEEGASLVLNNVPLVYDDAVSCIGAHENGRIVIAEGATQTFGKQGFGMQFWEGGSVTEIQENATLILENRFFLSGFGESYFDVLPGATLNVTEYTTGAGTSNDESLVVRLHEGGTFDMSRAPADVQRLFKVDAISSNQNLMPDGTFTAFPNPAQAGLTYVHQGTEARQLAQIEVVDITGRIVSTELPASNNSIYPVALPGSGLYVIRLTDVDGRVGHLKVMGK